MADEKSTNPSEDRELEDLLDSALNDFNQEKKTDTKDVQESNTSESIKKDTSDPISEDVWATDFIKQAADQFHENFQHLIQNGSESELGSSFEQMAQTVASVVADGIAADGDNTNTDFQSAIAKALNDLTANSENLQTEAEFTEMFNQICLDDNADAIFSYMRGMVKHFLSKEILYPSLKELVEKYPAWLEENKATVSPADMERFTKQYELMQKVCGELEKENDQESEETKTKRMETITSLMLEVQGCGHLPDGLFGEQSIPFPMDAEGDSVMNSLLRGGDSPQNCLLM